MRCLFYIVLLCLTVSSQAKSDAERFLISNFEHPLMHIMNKLITQSYRDIGIEVEFVTVPIGRGLKMLDAGQVDADVIRPDYIARRLPNVLSVPPVILRPQMVIFCRKQVPCTKEIMQNKQAVIHGFSYLNDSLRMKYTNAVKANFKSMTNYVQTIDLMKNGRIDYLMMSMIKGRMPEDLKSEFNHVILYQYEANHMVHLRHQYLVDQLSEALEKNLQKLQLTDLQE